MSGGSRSYVDRIAAPLRQRARATPEASAIRRANDGVRINDADGNWDRFDEVVIATHGDTALSLLDDPSAEEKRLLGSFGYVATGRAAYRSVLMPRRRDVWSSWNYVAGSRRTDGEGARDLLDEPAAELRRTCPCSSR